MSQHPQQSGQRPRANLYPTAVALPDETRIPVIQTLNQALADTTDLRSQAKFAHWNAKGTDFYQLHRLFDEIAEVLDEHADLLAERATALGSQAMGTTRLAATGSRLPEPPHDRVNEVEYLEWFTDHLGRHANLLRAAIDTAAEHGDEDTADLFTELSREVDTQLYFLESHLQSAVVQRIPATSGQAPARAGQGAGEPTGSQRWTGGQPPAGAPPPAGGQAPPGGQPRGGGQSAMGSGRGHGGQQGSSARQGPGPGQAAPAGQGSPPGQGPPAQQGPPPGQTSPAEPGSSAEPESPAERGAAPSRGSTPDQGTASDESTASSSEDEDEGQ